MNRLKKEGLVLLWPIHAGKGHTVLKPVSGDTQSSRLVLQADTNSGTAHKRGVKNIFICTHQKSASFLFFRVMIKIPWAWTC